MNEAVTQSADTGVVAENLRFLLLGNIGRQVVVDLWFGGETPVRRCGVLTAVGADYLLLWDELNRQEIAAALCALRLVTLCALQGATDTADTGDAGAADAAPEPQSTAPEPSGSVTQVVARPRSQAAFNYAKRKTRKLE